MQNIHKSIYPHFTFILNITTLSSSNNFTIIGNSNTRRYFGSMFLSNENTNFQLRNEIYEKHNQ